MKNILLNTILIALFSSAFANDTIWVAHYTETTGYNHGTKDESYDMFVEIANEYGPMVVDDYPDSNWMNSLENLEKYDVVVFSNTSGSGGMTSVQRANFEQYFLGGGNYLGIHAASDTYRHSSANGGSTGVWDWYAETLTGASVQQNPNHTSSSHNNFMDVDTHPTTASIPDPWNKTEEYYYWQNGYLAPGFDDVLNVWSTGSNSYDAPRTMARCREYPNGSRTFYTALGHSASNYTSDQNFKNLIRDALIWVAAPAIQSTAGSISGSFEKWDKVVLEFTTQTFTESPATYANYRMDVEFVSPSGKVIRVPGHFAADGNAGVTHATSGNVWRCYFVPGEVGQYTYTAYFRTGANIALDTTLTGNPVEFDGDTGSFVITPSTATDARAKGKLQYIGERYRKYADGEYFIKCGADAPENLLAYFAFDQTSDDGGSGNDLTGTSQYFPGFNYNGDGLHHYEIHQQDWNPGDPTINGDKGLIGALNYLASEGMTGYSGLLWNVGGDGDDVWPYTIDNIKNSFDVSKLDQWETVFWHGAKKGLEFHAKLFETENDEDMTENEWKLYFREMSSRFGHVLGWTWNLGEENTMSAQHIQNQAAFLDYVDPYDNHRVLHTYPANNWRDSQWLPQLGKNTLTGISVQDGANDIRGIIDLWRFRSDTSGRVWVISWDEQNGQNTGVSPNPGYPGNTTNTHPAIREAMNIGFIQGMDGQLNYFGYSLVHADLDCEDFRSRSDYWRYMRISKSVLHSVPFWNMYYAPGMDASNDNFVTTDGQNYLIFCKDGDDINIPGLAGTVKWISAIDSTVVDGTTTNPFTDDAFAIVTPAPAFPVENIEAQYSPRDGLCWQATGDGFIMMEIQHYQNGWVTDTTVYDLSGCYRPRLCGRNDIRVYSYGSYGEISWGASVDLTQPATIETGRISLSCDERPGWPYYVYDFTTGAQVFQGWTQSDGRVYIPFINQSGRFVYRLYGQYWVIEHQ